MLPRKEKATTSSKGEWLFEPQAVKRYESRLVSIYCMNIGMKHMSTASDSESINVCSGPLTAHACRLKPGADIVASIQRVAIAASQSTNHCSAVVVVSCVGSVSSLTLRMANASSKETLKSSPLRTWNEPLEIVSLVGTISITAKEDSEDDVSFHLHMSVSDKNGDVYGGHFVKGLVHTTMELVLGTISHVQFSRIYDPNTGYRELEVMR